MNKSPILPILPCRLYPLADYFPGQPPGQPEYVYVNRVDEAHVALMRPPYTTEDSYHTPAVQTALAAGLAAERQRMLDEAEAGQPLDRLGLQRVIALQAGTNTLPVVSLFDLQSGVLNNSHPLCLP